MEYLKKFAESKKVVRQEDIQEFFQQMQSRKRQRVEIPKFCKWFFPAKSTKWLHFPLFHLNICQVSIRVTNWNDIDIGHNWPPWTSDKNYLENWKMCENATNKK